MSIQVEDKAATAVLYQPLRTEGYRTAYIGAAHSDISKDQLTVSSIPPKRTAGSYGNRRASINLVRTVLVATPLGGIEAKDMKFELSTSVPVGVDVNAINDMFARLTSVSEADMNSIAVVGQTQL